MSQNALLLQIRILLAGLCLFFTPSLLASPHLELTENQERVSVLPYIDYLRDPTQHLLLEELQTPEVSRQFAPLSRNGQFGRTDDAIWLRFNIASGERSLFLEFLPITIDFLDIYILDLQSKKLLSEKHAGTARARSTSAKRTPFYVFELPHNADQPLQVFLRLQSRKTVNFSVTLNSATGITDYNLSRQLFLGTCFGGIFFVILFNLLLGKLFKREQILHLSGYIIAATLAVATHNGYVLRFFPGSPWVMDNLLPLFAYIMMCFSLLLARSFLEVKQSSPRWDQTLKILIYVSLAGMSASLLIDIAVNAYLGIPLLFIVQFILLATAVRATYQNHRNGLPFLIAICLHVLALSPYIAGIYATIPKFELIQELLLITLLLESLILSYAIWRDGTRQLHESLRSQRVSFQNDAAHNAETSTLKILGHELRNPIAGVIGLSELLLDSPMPPEQKDQVQSIRRSGHILLKWLNRLTDWSKLQRNQVQLQKLPFNLPSLITELVNDARSDSSERKSNLSVQLAPNLPLVLAGDPEHLKQLLQSLLDHALTHCWGSELELLVTQGEEHNDCLFTLQVTRSDLDIEYANQLLQNRDAQPSTLSSTDRELIIANYLCKLMNGKLTIKRDSKGIVTYQLTVNIPRHEFFQNNQPDKKALQGKRILIVDDSATTRKLLHKQTERWDMRPSTTPSGTEALAMMRTMANLGSFFELVIIDYSMPTMNGMELAERISSDPDLSGKSVLIMLTGASTAPSADTLKGAGICRVLEKPTSGNTLKLVFCEELAYFHAEQEKAKDTSEPT